jgi:hypothetical protein
MAFTLQLSEESKVSRIITSACEPDANVLQERVAKLIDISRVAIH